VIDGGRPKRHAAMPMQTRRRGTCVRHARIRKRTNRLMAGRRVFDDSSTFDVLWCIVTSPVTTVIPPSGTPSSALLDSHTAGVPPFYLRVNADSRLPSRTFTGVTLYAMQLLSKPVLDTTAVSSSISNSTIVYRVGQIKWHHFTFLLVTHDCIH